MTTFEYTGTILKSEDIRKSVDFYKTLLNFSVDYISGDPPNYAVIYKDNVYLHLSNDKTLPYLAQVSCAFIIVKGINQIYNEVLRNKCTLIYQLKHQDHGQGVKMVEFTFRDIDGNVLRISELFDD